MPTDPPVDLAGTAPPVLQSPQFGEIVAQPVVFRWESDSAFEGYRLQVAYTASYGLPIIDSVVFGKHAMIVSGLPHDTLLYWRVGGIIQERLRWSATREVTAQMEGVGPALIAPDDGMRTTPPVTLQWSEHDGTDDFFLRISADRAFADVVLDTALTGRHTLQIDGFLDGPTYFWQVGARVSDTVFWSEIRSFTCDVPPPEGYHRCTFFADGISFQTEVLRRSFAGGDTVLLDTVTVSFEDYTQPFARTSPQGRHFLVIRMEEPRTFSIEAEWSTAGTISSFQFLERFYASESFPSGWRNFEDRRFEVQAEIPWIGDRGVYRARGAGEISRLFSRLQLAGEAVTFQYTETVRTLDVHFAPDAELRLTFE